MGGVMTALDRETGEVRQIQLPLFEGETTDAMTFALKAFNLLGLDALRLGTEMTVDVRLTVACISVEGYRDKDDRLIRKHQLVVTDQELLD